MEALERWRLPVEISNRLTSDLVNNELIELNLLSNLLADGSVGEAGSMAPTVEPWCRRRHVGRLY